MPLTDRSRLRLVVLGVLVISLVATLIGRLWYLQILAGPTFQKLATSNQTRDIITAAPRGDILDDLGRPLVDNKTALVITVDRAALNRQSDEGKAVLHRLSRIIGVSYSQLATKTQYCTYPKLHGRFVARPKGCWSGSPYEPIPVSEVKPSVAATRKAILIQEMQDRFPGVAAGLATVRHYPQPDQAEASAILGYITPINAAQLKALSPRKRMIERGSLVGTTGLEAAYESYLHGHEGVKEVTVDHLGTQTGVVKNTPPRAGDDIVTNLDAKVQAALETQLQAAIDNARHSGYSADFAAGVVMNVKTGGIVAMASNPSYKPNHAPPTLTKAQYTHLLHEPGHPLFDKAYEGASAPGSSFKLISASGLLWDHTASTGTPIDCSASYLHKINFEGEVGGYESLHQAIVQSCDTVFYRLANADWNRDNRLLNAHKKAIEGVQHIAHEYGLGENPGVDLPGAAYGHIADRYNQKLTWEDQKANWCKGARTEPVPYLRKLDAYDCRYGWKFMPGDQMDEDIGQGTVTVSPMQLAVAYAALANGGTVFKPRVAKAIMSPAGKLIKRIKAPVRDHLSVSKYDLDYIRSAMYGVTSETGGTATSTFAGFPMNRVLVGGKTGTAELSGTTTQNGSWFASFAGPAGGKPQYVCVIEVNKSKQGAISAAPYVRNIWEQLYGLGGHKALFPNGVPPTKLPKVGTAAVRAEAKLASQSQLPGHHAKSSGKSSTPSSPTTPTNGAAGLPPGLPVSLRGPQIEPRE